MSSVEFLQFLRPYAIQPLSAKRAAYLGVYRYVQQGGLRGRPNGKGFATSLRKRDAKKDNLNAEEDVHAARSHAIASRIEELNRADALVYPRIQRCGSHMRIPEFREKYKDVSSESPGQDEVVLRGMHPSQRVCLPCAHDVQGDSSPSAEQAPNWSSWT